MKIPGGLCCTICFTHHCYSLLPRIAALVWICFRRPWQAIQESWYFWFFTSCLFHSVIDLMTYNDDGPLLYIPFDWTYRFTSPISYWDSDHFGREFSVFELILDSILILTLILLRRRQQDRIV